MIFLVYYEGLRRIGFPWMGDCGTLNTTRLYVTIRIIVIIISIILICGILLCTHNYLMSNFVQVKMATGLPGVPLVLVIRPVGEVLE